LNLQAKQPEVFRAMRQKILNFQIEMAWTKPNIIPASCATAGHSSENLALTQNSGMSLLCM